MARLALGALALALLAGCCQAMQDVVTVARANNATQFVTVLEQAIDQGLIDLSQGGPYTILAPTNAAWSKLSSQELEGVLGDSALLKDVLQYHVIQGEVFSWDLTSGRVLTTLGGHAVRVYHTGQSIYMNNGHVVKADLEATNAVVHLIDEVLDVPEGTIYAVARGTEYPLSTFADFLDKARLNHTLDSVGSRKYTVFAPSNEAFGKLSQAILDRIHSSASYERELLMYHIHPGTLHMRSLDRNGTLSTLDSYHKIKVTVNADIYLNELATLEQGDIDCDNGVLHVIDHVLIPSSFGNIIG